MCASWVASGVNRDKIDLQRLLGLLVKVLDGTLDGPDPSYNERATTMLQLGVLESWATLYSRAIEGGEPMAHLKTALQPHVPRLGDMWLDALRDYALVSLPPEYATQVPEMGAFYSKGTRATVRGYYEQAFPRLLLAVALQRDLAEDTAGSTTFLLLGLCVRTLAGSASAALSVTVLKALCQVRGGRTKTGLLL